MILSGIVSFTLWYVHTLTCTDKLAVWAAQPLWYVALLLVTNENQISSEHKSRVSKINPPPPPSVRLSI